MKSEFAKRQVHDYELRCRKHEYKRNMPKGKEKHIMGGDRQYQFGQVENKYTRIFLALDVTNFPQNKTFFRP